MEMKLLTVCTIGMVLGLFSLITNLTNEIKLQYIIELLYEIKKQMKELEK